MKKTNMVILQSINQLLNHSVHQFVHIYYIANLNFLQSFNVTKTTVVPTSYWSHHCFIMAAGCVSCPLS